MSQSWSLKTPSKKNKNTRFALQINNSSSTQLPCQAKQTSKFSQILNKTCQGSQRGKSGFSLSQISKKEQEKNLFKTSSKFRKCSNVVEHNKKKYLNAKILTTALSTEAFTQKENCPSNLINTRGLKQIICRGIHKNCYEMGQSQDFKKNFNCRKKYQYRSTMASSPVKSKQKGRQATQMKLKIQNMLMQNYTVFGQGGFERSDIKSSIKRFEQTLQTPVERQKSRCLSNKLSLKPLSKQYQVDIRRFIPQQLSYLNKKQREIQRVYQNEKQKVLQNSNSNSGFFKHLKHRKNYKSTLQPSKYEKKKDSNVLIAGKNIKQFHQKFQYSTYSLHELHSYYNALLMYSKGSLQKFQRGVEVMLNLQNLTVLDTTICDIFKQFFTQQKIRQNSIQKLKEKGSSTKKNNSSNENKVNGNENSFEFSFMSFMEIYNRINGLLFRQKIIDFMNIIFQGCNHNQMSYQTVLKIFSKRCQYWAAQSKSNLIYQKVNKSQNQTVSLQQILSICYSDDQFCSKMYDVYLKQTKSKN